MVQFNHRYLAISTLASVSSMYLYAKTTLNKEFWNALPRNSRLGFHSVIGASCLQVSLGIATLLYYVNIHIHHLYY